MSVAAIPDRPADMQITLPAPPSTNKLWVPVRRGKMALSDAYKAWIVEAGWSVQQQRAGDAFLGAYALRLTFGTGHDVDNVKAVPDLLQRQGTVVNDAGCDVLMLVRDRARRDRTWLAELWSLA